VRGREGRLELGVGGDQEGGGEREGGRRWWEIDEGRVKGRGGRGGKGGKELREEEV